MKNYAVSLKHRALAILCICFMVMGLLPAGSAHAEDTFSYNLHEEIKDGTIARPGQLIQANCDTQDYESCCNMNFYVDGQIVDRVISYLVSDGEVIPAYEGIDYWKSTYSSIVTEEASDNNGNTITRYNGMVNFEGVPLASENDPTIGNDLPYFNNNVPSEEEYFDYWDNMIAQNALIDFGEYQPTDDLQSSNNEPIENRQSGGASDTVVYQVVEQFTDPNDAGNNGWAPDNNPRGPVNPDGTPTPTPEEPRGQQNPDNEPQSTPFPTPELQQIYVPPVANEPVEVVATVKEPDHVVYDIGLEVGRYAKITPKYSRNDTKKSSNTKIILDPRSDTGSFSASDYEARAMSPGDAKLTFANNTENYIEDWNVHVYCRPLDFDKTQYVVYSPKDKDAWITLYLKYFEYEYEYAYDFVWSSSEDSKEQSKRQIYLAGGTTTTTYARYCVKKGTEGAFKISVKDKYGNSSSTVLIVRPEQVPDTKKDTKTDTEKKDDQSGKSESTKLTKSQIKTIKKKYKKTQLDLSASYNNGKIKMTWDDDVDSYNLPYYANFDGYDLKYTTSKNGKYKKLKVITNPAKLTYSFKPKQKGKTYYLKARAYKIINGEKVYTDFSKVIKVKTK